MSNAKHFQFFTFSFIILTIFVKGQMDSKEMRLQNQFNPDVRYDLTENDLKLALNELSLDDLQTLQEFIDYADYNYLDYKQNSLINGKLNIKTNDIHNQQIDNVMDSPGQGDYNFEPQNSENNIIYNPDAPRNFIQLLTEKQRTKRDDRKENTIDEYVKQLDYSFPQNLQENNYNDMEFKKAHIRIKRN